MCIRDRPCSVAELHAAGMDYWALGHIHQRQAHAGARTVIMPGMPQGRDINEAGPKTVSLVTVGDDRRISVEERLTSIAEFARVTLDISDAADWRDLVHRIGRALEEKRARTRSPHLVARLKLTGASDLAFQIRRDLDLLKAEAEQRGEAVGRTWIDKVELDLAGSAAVRAGTADPVFELAALMQAEIVTGHGFREDVREMVLELRDYLPTEARRFTGNSEEELDAFLDWLMKESGEDIVARLKAAAPEAG